jgi:hypothetical protein
LALALFCVYFSGYLTCSIENGEELKVEKLKVTQTLT